MEENVPLCIQGLEIARDSGKTKPLYSEKPTWSLKIC